jgi:hypothetical protein
MVESSQFQPGRSMPIFQDKPHPKEVRQHEQLLKDLAPLVDRDCRIYTNLRWSQMGKWSHKPTGEADLLILHPWGMAVIEVKGGAIQKRGGIFYSRNRDGEHVISNPFKQADDNGFALRKWILEEIQSVWKNRPKVQTRTAAYFPDCIYDGDRDESPRTFFDLMDRQSNLADALWKWIQVQDAEGHGGEVRIDASAWDSLMQHGLQQGEFHVVSLQDQLRRHALGQTQESMKIATRMIPEIVAQAPCHRVLYTGGPGTGKTTILLAQAKRLALSGQSALLVCYNLPLAHTLQKMVHELGHSIESKIHVRAFHKLCQEILIDNGITPQVPEDPLAKSAYFQTELPTLARDYLHKHPGRLLWDAVLVDESQDFQEQVWWDVLCALQSGAEAGEWYLAGDAAQAIHQKELWAEGLKISEDLRELPLPNKIQHWPLRHNFRNSAPLCQSLKQSKLWKDLLSPYHQVGTNELKDTPIEVITPQELGPLIAQMAQRYGIDPAQAGSLALVSRHTFERTKCGTENLSHCSWGQWRPWNRKDREDRPLPKHHLLFDTIFRHKGLEYDGVILFHVQDKMEKSGHKSYEQALLAQAISRARHRVWIVKSESESHL